MKQEFTFKKRDKAGLLIKLRSFFDSLDDNTEYKIVIDKVRNRRSRDANAYFWVLADKVAEKTGVPKAEIYRNYIKDVGGVSEVIPVRNDAVDKFCRIWSSNGLGFLTETVPSKLDGYKNVIAYYGSHTFDTAQMSRLIDLCIQDCKALDIETATPAELALLLESWDGTR